MMNGNATNRSKKMTKYNAGTIIEMGLAYQGEGRYAPDGAEGTYTVLATVQDEGSKEPWLTLVRGRKDITGMSESDATNYISARAERVRAVA